MAVTTFQVPKLQHFVSSVTDFEQIYLIACSLLRGLSAGGWAADDRRLDATIHGLYINGLLELRADAFFVARAFVKLDKDSGRIVARRLVKAGFAPLRAESVGGDDAPEQAVGNESGLNPRGWRPLCRERVSNSERLGSKIPKNAEHGGPVPPSGGPGQTERSGALKNRAPSCGAAEPCGEMREGLRADAAQPGGRSASPGTVGARRRR